MLSLRRASPSALAAPQLRALGWLADDFVQWREAPSRGRTFFCVTAAQKGEEEMRSSLVCEWRIPRIPSSPFVADNYSNWTGPNLLAAEKCARARA